MTYWVKDCDCRVGGCKTNAPHITAEQKDDVIIFTMTIALYRCSVCAKAWKMVEELPTREVKA